MSSPDRPKKVGLLGPFGFGNLGDAAIQQAVIQYIRRHIPNAQIYGFSENPEDTFKRHGIQSFLINAKPPGPNSLVNRIPRYIQRRKWWGRLFMLVFYYIPVGLLLMVRAFNTLKGFDLLIASGGGQLDDYWGGAWEHPHSLFRWAAVAKIRRTKFMFVSVGAGPLDAPLSRRFIKYALSLASHRSYRDESSKEYIEREVGFYRDDPIYPDLAYSLISTNHQEPFGQKRSRLMVGIGPMAWFDPRTWPERDSAIYQGYLKKLAEFTAFLIRKDYAVLIYPGEAEQDREPIEDFREILNKMNLPNLQEQIVAPTICTVDELMAHLSQTDLIVASRFHGALLPMLLHKPVLALSYHDKVDALMRDTGQAEYCLSIANFDVETLIERFTALEANGETIQHQLARKSQEYQAALNEQYERIFCNL